MGADHCFAPVHSCSSAMWAIFHTCAADSTIVFCNPYQLYLKCGNSISHLGITCMIRYMTAHQYTQWEQHMNVSSQKQKGCTLSCYSFSTHSHTIQDSLPAPPRDRDETLSRRVIDLPYSTSSAKKDRHGATQKRGEQMLNFVSAHPTLPFTALSPSRQAYLPQLLECKKKYASSISLSALQNVCLYNCSLFR